MSLLAISPAEKQQFRRRLLAWFAEQKRDLPWRRTKDPYRIWLSEIMLQQTRVAAVIPYYERFVAKFPSVRALARARTETVLRHWAGLGYYSRAKNLQCAAKEMIVQHGGAFPREFDRALALPGIGRYTGAAVLSIAYEEPLAVLDGNVARVLARIGAVRGDLRAPALWRSLEDAAQELLARNAPGDWNQAMMELGATLCTPKSPRCPECPVSR
ncbi:MAG: A/G-specific adenine glycosylase, partial [Candidatus Acidiferrales bacterium]